MIDLGQKMAAAFRRKFIGTRQEILIEKIRPHNYGEGFTPHYLRARVALESRGRGWVGKLAAANIEKEDGQLLCGTLPPQT